MPKVDFIRPELVELFPQYTLIDDVIKGEVAVKDKGEEYLPLPNNRINTPEGVARYDSYITRAVFYGVTRRTLQGMLGQVFYREPTHTVPATLEPVLLDATGQGVSAEQFAKRLTGWNLSLGRAGVFIDYPKTDNPTTQLDLRTGRIRPTFTAYRPENIINWRVRKVGAVTRLSLVVLAEAYEKQDENDEFKVETATQYRVLRLDDANVYNVELWRKMGGANYEIAETFRPTDYAGNPFDEIPFVFTGAENNDTVIDLPPLYDLASLNLAHYRNSADYEEACFIAGQPTPVVTGVNERWINEVLGGGFMLGSRTAIMLPQDCTATLLQAETNSMPFEAMAHKERQMVALGAKLVEQAQVQRTATEADNEEAAENSILSTVAQNTGDAIAAALMWAQRFVSGADTEIKYELNTDFTLSRLSSEDRKQVVQEWQTEAITFSEMRANLRRGGVATLPDNEARAELERDAERFAEPTEPSPVDDGDDGDE